MKLLAQAEEAASFHVPDGVSLAAKGEVVKYRLAGQSEAAMLRSVLFPEDDDG